MGRSLKLMLVLSILVITISNVFAGEMIDYTVDTDICRFSDYFDEKNTLPYVRVSSGRIEVDKEVSKSGIAIAQGSIEVKEDMGKVQVLTSSDVVRINSNVENVTIFAPTVIIDGEISGTALIFSESIILTENSNVSGDIIAYAQQIKVGGNITGNVIVTSENIEVLQTAKIHGSLRFYSNVASISSNALIDGKVYCKTYNDVQISDVHKDYVQVVKLNKRNSGVKIPFLKIIVSSLIFAGIYVKIISKKNILNRIKDKLNDKSYIALMLGFGMMFILPLIILISIFLLIFGLGCLAGPLIVFAMSIFIFAITIRIFVTGILILDSMLSSKYSKYFESLASKFVFATIVFITLYLLECIPTIGTGILYAYLIITLGCIISLFINIKKENK